MKSPGQITQSNINPSLFMRDKHQLNHPIQYLCVRHILQIDGFALRILSEPRFLEIGVQSFDDVRFLVLEDGRKFFLRGVENRIIHFLPQHDSSSCEFVNRFAEFRTYRDDTTCGSFVRLFPVFIIKTRSVDNCLFRLQLVKSTREYIPPMKYALQEPS